MKITYALVAAAMVFSYFAHEVSGRTKGDDRDKLQPQGLCNTRDPKTLRDSSEKEGMGLGGVRARHCPGKELYWVANDTTSAMCYRNDEGKILALDGALAEFSPDCQWFWTLTNDGLGVHNARTGKLIRKVPGNLAAWSASSKELYFQRNERTSALIVRMHVPSAREEAIVKVADFAQCIPPGEGTFWEPPKLGKNQLEWIYLTRSQPPKDFKAGIGAFPAKKVTIDLRSKKITRTEWISYECDGIF